MNHNSLPVEVADNEKVARAIFHPYHFNKKNQLHFTAFKAPAGRKDVSVNRLRALDANACKQKAKEIVQPGKEYRGFAVIVVGEVRKLGSDVVDSREPPNYWGHADIIHAIILQKGEAAPPEFNHALREMVRNASFYADPEPQSDGWIGEDFAA